MISSVWFVSIANTRFFRLRNVYNARRMAIIRLTRPVVVKLRE